MDSHEYANLFPMMTDEELQQLCESMKAGYDETSPIVLYGGKILDGRNRQRAADAVGITPLYRDFIGSDKEALDFVIRHNLTRRHLNETQRAVIGSRLANMERGGDGSNQHSKSANLHNSKVTQSEAATMMNVSPRMVATVKAIEKAAPELIARMESGQMTANEAQREVSRRKVIDNLESIEVQEVKALSGVYDVIVIDPPWPMQKIERDVAPNQVNFEYPVMSLDDIGAINIPAADDCHFFLWTTHKYLPAALQLLDKWNMKYICTFVWHKNGGFQPFGLPQFNCEFVLYARRGTPQFIDFKDFMVCFNAPRGAHSEKPEEFYNLLRRVTTGRRLDMFNRRLINGFDGWGNEAK